MIRITKTEIKIIRLLLFTNSQIASRLVCSIYTVKTFVHQLMRKFSASTRTEIILKALRNNIIDIREIQFPNDLDLDECYDVKGDDYDKGTELVGQVSDEDTKAYRERQRLCKKVRVGIS